MCRIKQDSGLDRRTAARLDRKQFNAVTHTVNTGNRDAQEQWDAN